MRAKGVRGIAILVAVFAVLSGCGNFTLSGLLDSPPDIPPGPRSLTIAPSTINAMVSTTVRFSAGGGVGPYDWTADDGLFTASGKSVDYPVPVTEGTYTVTVRDSATEETQSATVYVTADIPLSISPVFASVNAGSSVTLTAAGGTWPYSYSWTETGAGSLDNPTSPTSTYTTVAGTAESVTVTVTEAGSPTPRNATIEVSVPVSLSLSPKDAAVLVGGSVAFSAAGGSGSYEFTLVAGSGILASGNYEAPDIDEKATIKVTDLVTGESDQTDLTVYFPLTIIPTSVAVAPGADYQFTAFGGVPYTTGGPYRYTVTGSGSIQLESGLYTAAGGPGDTVTVEDLLHNSSIATVSIVAPPGGWGIVSIDAGARSGQYASLALTAGGLPRIAYYESQGKELRFASFDGSLWTHQVVDTAKSVGKYASLALEPGSGYARIGYYDEKNGELQYAAWNGSAWARQTIDSAGDVGQYASLALEPGTGRPRIAYYNATARDLKYAAWNGSSWVKETVDSIGDVGQYASLALDPSGQPRIAYYDFTNKNLKFVEKNGASWDPAIVVDGDTPVTDVGQYASLALDPGGAHFPRIAYYNATNKDLEYAAWDGAAWVFGFGTPPVDGAGDVGKFASLKLDPLSGLPRIAYYNGTAQDLKFAQKP